MNWVTVIWSKGSGACLTLALMHLVVWWKERTSRANLIFAVMAVAVAVFAALELAMMRAQTPEEFGIAIRWVHVPVWIITVSLVATGVPNPWMLVAQLSLVLLVIFVVDATIAVWRRGDRRQALMVGGSILLFTMAGTVEGIAITWGIISMPLTASLFYQGLVVVMACELSYDVIHAAALARQLQVSDAGLRESEERFQIVADAAPVLIWMSGLDKLCTFFNKPWLKFTGRSLEQ